MSYSRWGSSRWYTFWAGQDIATENRDTAIFRICCGAIFTAAELRADMESCLTRAVAQERNLMSGEKPVSDEEREELRGYMTEFLADIDEAFPATP